MTLQEMFTTAVKHLARQAKRATIYDGCKYLIETEGTCPPETREVLMCAVGCMIPRELYRPDFEGHGVEYLMEHDDLRDYFMRDNYAGYTTTEKFLRSLQHVHDNEMPTAWRSELYRISREYGLTMPRVDWSACQ